MLLLLFTPLAEVSAQAADTSCAAVEAQLPSFVDYEIAYGPAAAARTFPEVWWHTLVCTRCAELYQELRELAALATIPWPAADRQSAVEPWPRLRLQIPVGVLRSSITARQALGARLGDASDETLLTEGEAEEVSIQLSMRPGPGHTTQLIVRTVPPIQGAVLLSFAQFSYREPLNSQGAAIFAALPEALFSTHPDMVLTVAIKQMPE